MVDVVKEAEAVVAAMQQDRATRDDLVRGIMLCAVIGALVWIAVWRVWLRVG
ncbi:MAG TPA: hypothetical protein VFH61_10465 [Thermoleophilia bacterium]|nr:hypothetical protein [Thermoleophilia bacterium]